MYNGAIHKIVVDLGPVSFFTYLTQLVVLCMLASCAQLPAATGSAGDALEPKGSVIAYGIYDVVKAGRLQSHPATSTGKIISQPVLRLKQSTRHIPLEKDTYFGYQYRIEYPAPTGSWVKLKRIVSHPPMTRPDGGRTTGSQRIIRKKVDAGAIIALDGYAFNEKYEMVAGEWRFQLWHQDSLLLEQRFTSYRSSQTGQSD